jgi:thiol-disulfide isomerase/thioredoxin
MKKFIIIGFILTLLIVSTVQALPYTENKTKTNNESVTASFTHTVFAEECTATWCPNCPMAAEALHNIYQSGDYPFYYVALVNDKNSVAKQRNHEYSITGIVAFPTVYFDGGDKNMVGRANTVQETENDYRALIEQEGQRTPKQPLNMSSSVTWNGNAKLTVTINITNDGSLPYLGRLRSYVTEITSRWKDNSGNPYGFGFIDYAVNKIVILMPGKTKTITANFDGAAMHGNQTYADITADNIMVISAVFHWIPHYRIGYQDATHKQIYFAHYADQCTAATPN